MNALSDRAREIAKANEDARWLDQVQPCEDLLRELADEIDRLQAIVERQHAALIIAGTECDALGESDLHELAQTVALERGDDETTDDDYAEAYIRAVEALGGE